MGVACSTRWIDENCM